VRGGKRLLALALVPVLAFAGAFAHPPRQAAACDTGLTACQQMEQAQGQIDAAERQLDQIQGQQQDAQSKATAINNLISGLQQQIASQQAAIQQTVSEIVATQREIRFTQAAMTRAQAELGARQELLDERVGVMASQGQGDYLEVVATATSFNQFIDRLSLIRDVIRSDQQLVDRVKDTRAQLDSETDQLSAQQAQEQKLLASQRNEENQLDNSLATQQQGLQEEQQLIAQLNSQGGQVQSQISGLQTQVQELNDQYQQQLAAQLAASTPAPSGGDSYSPSSSGDPLQPLFSWVPAGGSPDYFPFGQCTFWAAYNHMVTWSGNATDWYDNAIAQGAQVSQSPSVGSIVVWGAGNGYSIYGHVAIVVAVYGSGAFTVSEMNYEGEGIIDTRTVYTRYDVEGFIV
jgi:peptidoglycan DL-endopeptidase CwlO